ncbi:hypothetical protein ABPG74_014149 [Tetrahymena malaccensis]
MSTKTTRQSAKNELKQAEKVPKKQEIDKEDQEDEEEEKKDSKQSIEYNWSTHKTIGVGLPKGHTADSDKIASFDMDYTIIKTKSGKKFPQNEHDWLLWDAKVKSKMQQLHKDGFTIVIFSNQGGVGKNHTTHKEINTKITNIANELQLPIFALYATQEDENKKPNKGMWEYFISKIKTKPTFDQQNSFYCGDAAGRKAPVKDFSDSDLKFALNIGLTFYTPDQLFLDKKETISTTDFFNPKNLPTSGDLFKQKGVKTTSDKQEMVIMIGSAGSGKSTFVQNYLKDYVRVNRDTLKTMPKCLEAAEKAIQQKKNVVVDNTNPTVESRKDFIALAKKHKIQVRAFDLQITKDLAFHLDNQRENNKNRTHFSKRVGKIPIHKFFKDYQAPTEDEGFDQIGTVNFIAGPFNNKADEESFFSFTK